MRIFILFICLALATAELEEFFKMWQVAMEQLATTTEDNNDVPQTTQKPLIATDDTATYVSNQSELSLSRSPYTHSPWASYQENLAFVYTNVQRHQHQYPSSLQYQNTGTHLPNPQNPGDQQNVETYQLHRGNLQYQPNRGFRQQNHEQYQQNHGLHQQNLEQYQHNLKQYQHNLEQYQQDHGLHQQRPSLHQRHPNPSVYTPSPDMPQTVPSAPYQYGTPVMSSHRDIELALAEQYVSEITRQLGNFLNERARQVYQDRYTSSFENPTVTAPGSQINSPTGITWYQNSFQTPYPSPSYTYYPHHSLRRTRYPRELSMFDAPETNPFMRSQTPSTQLWHGQYMKEEEREPYGNTYGWGQSNSYPTQTMLYYNQRNQLQRHLQQPQQPQQYTYQSMQPMNQNYGQMVQAYQPTYSTTSNMAYNTQRSMMYPSTPTVETTFTQGSTPDKQGMGMEMNPVIPTFKTAFTRSNIPAPQSSGITAYIGQNQNTQQSTMASNNLYSSGTRLSWPSQTGSESRKQNITQRNDQTQNVSQNQWSKPPPFTPQEAVQYKYIPPPPPGQVIDLQNQQRPASPEEIIKMNTKPIPKQTSSRTPSIDQLAYYRPDYLHRVILNG